MTAIENAAEDGEIKAAPSSPLSREVVGVDLFDRSWAFTVLLPKLTASYALDSLEYRGVALHVSLFAASGALSSSATSLPYTRLSRPSERRRIY